MLNRVMKAIRGEEKPTIIIALWLFAGNMIWIGYYIDSVYIDKFVHLGSIYYNISLTLIVLYLPFSIYLLWKNIKNLSPIKLILSRLSCGILTVIYMALAYMIASDIVPLRSGTEVGVSLYAIGDKGFMPIKNKNTLIIYIDKKPEYSIIFY